MGFTNTSRELGYAWTKLFAKALEADPALTPQAFSKQLLDEIKDATKDLDGAAIEAASEAAFAKSHVKAGG